MSFSWQWSRATGAVRNRKCHHDEHVAGAASEQSFQSVALVVGATGIVGASLVDILPQPDTPGGPWKVYALSRRNLPPWSKPSSASVIPIQVDLTDFTAVAEALTQLTDITHVFYVAWMPYSTEAQNREKNSAMFRNIISAVVTSCPGLVHVSLQTGTKHYMGPFELIGQIAQPEPPYTEDMLRLDCPNFYYDQEDITRAYVERKADVSACHANPFGVTAVYVTPCALA